MRKILDINLPTKMCIVCSSVFRKTTRITYPTWERRKICSLKCRILFMRINNIGYKKGHSGYKNSGNFKEGHIAWNRGTHIQTNNALKKYFSEGGEIWNKDKTGIFSDQHLNKIREARKKQILPSGPNHWNWKGGTSELRKRLQQSSLYREWRSSVFKRDNYTCQFCGIRGGVIHADHIKAYSVIISDNNIKTVGEAKKCRELWDIKNGRTLCVSCHQKTDTYKLNQHSKS